VRALRCREHGAVSALVVEEIQDPSLLEGGVIVDVVAASVNFPDLLIIADQYQVRIPVPFTPGGEFAGIVGAVEPGVESFSVGDRVMGTSQIGAFAEKIVVPAGSLRLIPPAIDFTSAAAFGIAYRTAYLGLRTVANVKRGEWLVVLGAAGGVGLAAVELGHILGARVLAAASSAPKLEVCRRRGAEATVNYSEEDLKLRIRQLSGEGADVILDPVGGALSEQALRAIRYGGRFVSTGFASGEIPCIPLNLVLLKGPVVTGFTLDALEAHRTAEVAEHETELWRLFTERRVQPHIGGIFELDQAKHALLEMGGRRAIGKLVVTIQPCEGLPLPVRRHVFPTG
jgi:NADPH2:quinone reductase